MQQQPPPSAPKHPSGDFRNPKIHSDLLALYTRFFQIHRNMSKYLRISILEKEILGSLSEMMRLTIEINVMKSSLAKPPLSEVLSKLQRLRAYVENIKAFSTLLWQTKGITEGFFLGSMAQIESISKQIVGWERYLSQNMSRQPPTYRS